MGLTGMALAIDAGNSKTDVALVATDGRVLATARGGGFRPPAVGVERAVDVLAPLVASVLAEAGVGGAAGAGGVAGAAGAAGLVGAAAPLGAAGVSEPAEVAGAAGPVDHLSAFLANADLPVEEAQLTAEITRRGWAGTVTVRNDTFALLRAGLPDDGEPVGVAVVCGAGINCAGVGRDGATARFPAIGRISGDWGGGAHLADEALWCAARAEDGRGAPTELARALPAHFGLTTMRELIEALHLHEIPGHRRHELPPVLFAVATAGDRVARTLVTRQAEEIALLARVALERLGLLDEPAPVILGGGILTARHPLLHNHLTQLLTDHAPKVLPHLVTAPPVLGAALDTLDRAGATAGAYERVRRAWG
ncbi:BadF/BadG/BcrA/BcrD ATPase family protein [Streptomyces sp. P9-2B-2]|uniref:N-acetylglucosamine kinase n=1 Tax=Streptomyces sp. P9-2B-2 TaxID=3057114 RepID=UPI0025B518B6|nr:BadF/BadG/BcrA/BcrD ATPase family protein [Streptomyces sp. P9-2B-2]WJY38308.1 BadF/BadG/BcrA/BcrD ATPase family protein [Streptomyces sp. P9-2B-2]